MDLKNVRKGYRLVIESELSDKPITCNVIGTEDGKMAVVAPVLFYLHPDERIADAMRALGANVLDPDSVQAVIPPSKKQRIFGENGSFAQLVAQAENSLRADKRAKKTKPIEADDSEDDSEDAEPIAPARKIRRA